MNGSAMVPGSFVVMTFVVMAFFVVVFAIRALVAEHDAQVMREFGSRVVVEHRDDSLGCAWTVAIVIAVIIAVAGLLANSS